jgi:hypothetical protein
MTPESSNVSNAVPENPAITRCMNALRRAYQAGLADGKSKCSASMDGEAAYRSAMPRLSGQENIRDFIACVAHGMLIETIEESSATKLLYAAQVALATVRNQPSPPQAGAE